MTPSAVAADAGAAPAAPATAAPATAAARPGGGAFVLCVDDEPQVLEGLRLQLQRHHPVLTACSGAEGLRLLAEQPIAAIISDMRMPQMDGATFLRRARELAPDTPRILLTGQAEISAAVAAVNQGQIFGFLLKPCPPAALLAAVTAAVGRHRLAVAQRLLLEQAQTPQEDDLEQALRALFGRAVQLFGCRYAALALQGQDGAAPTLLLSHGLDAQLFGAAHDPAVTGQLLLQQEALHLQAADSAAPLQGLPPGHPEVWQLLGVPLASASGCHGWMYFAEGRRRASFGPDDMQAAAVLANAAAQLCEAGAARRRARQQAQALHAEQASRDRAEARAERMARAQNLLRAVIAARGDIGEREALLQELCRAAVLLGGYAQAWVGALRQDSLQPLALHGAGPAFTQRLCQALAPAGSPCDADVAAALRGSRALVWNGPDCAARCGEQASGGFRSMAAVPLSAQGQCIGALFLHAPEADWFDASEMSLLGTLATEVSQALDHLQREQQLRHLADHDALTGLPNRRHFLHCLEQHLAADTSPLAVALLDLERFKYLNDSLGHDAGDELLRQVAARLRDCAQDDAAGGLAARVAGDRFALALPLQGGAGDAEAQLLRRALQPVEAPLQLGAETVHPAARLGYALFPEDGDSAGALLCNAEAAMKAAKTAPERLRRYTPQMSQAGASRTRLEQLLRHALTQRQLQLRYQPIVDLRSGALAGAEALLRWHSSELGWVSPVQFVPVLEDTGMILEVGQWIVRQALEDVRRWQALAPAVPPVAVNVAAAQLRTPGLVGLLGQAAAGQPGALAVEITESTLIGDAEDTIAMLHRIRALGITIAIDDFGTGYSSLAYLSRLPVSSIKIDRSFIVALDHGGEALVASIIALARTLSLSVTAEGVETASQLECLRRLGCDRIQGFLFSRALDSAAFGRLLCAGTPLQPARSTAP